MTGLFNDASFRAFLIACTTIDQSKLIMEREGEDKEEVGR